MKINKTLRKKYISVKKTNFKSQEFYFKILINYILLLIWWIIFYEHKLYSELIILVY